MRVYRASRKPSKAFDALDSSSSVAGAGWRWNDRKTEILYVAEVQALALCEVTMRPGWASAGGIIIAIIEIPDDSVANPKSLGIVLPSNWNYRPAAIDSQRVGREFLEALTGKPKICGMRVPSVVSTTDFNILLDPSRKAHYREVGRVLIPFSSLVAAATS